MNKTAVKSMLTLALGLVLLIGVWSILGRLVYPSQESSDKYLTFVTEHEPLLRQIAEAAMDESLWPGLMDTTEVQNLLAEGDITGINGNEDHAVFRLASDVLQDTRSLLYLPDGVYTPERAGHGERNWQEATGEGSIQKWTSSGGATLSARTLTNQFILEDAYIPG